MEVVEYPEKRVNYTTTDESGFYYIRKGELLKEELQEVLKFLGAWSPVFETQTKAAWRKHIRYAVGIEVDEAEEYDKFDKHELTDIWRAVREDA